MRVRPLPLVLALLVAAPFAHADYIWASLDLVKKKVEIGLQEIPGQKPLDLGERIPTVKAFGADKKPVKLTVEETFLTAEFTGDVIGVDLNYGVIDRKAQGRGILWLYYWAKAATTAQASQKKLGLGVELFATVKDGKPVITVLYNGKPAAKSAIVAELDNSEIPFKGETAEDGTITLPVIKGKLAVRALVAENVPGTEGGKAYELRRSYGSLTVQKL